MNDQMRAEFEEWAVSMGFELRGHNGNYLKEIHCAWMAWKASRAALVVELPAEEEHKGAHYDIDYMRTDSVLSAIQSAGASVK